MFTREERNVFGDEAEDFAFNNLDRQGIKVLKTKEIDKWSPQLVWSPKLDQKIGDLIIVLFSGYIFVDIKRSSISKLSLRGFKGNYYFVYNVNLTELFIFKPEDIKNCREISYEKLGSGDEGLKLAQLKNYVSYMSLNEFILKLR